MIVVRDLIKEVVNKVSIKMTPKLVLLDSGITGVHFMAGHPIEISNRLLIRSKEGKEFDKYPLVALFQDFEESKGKLPGIDSEVSLNLIIARATDPNFVADNRYDSNFVPFLLPIYDEFLNQLFLSGDFNIVNTKMIDHTKIDRLFWGSMLNNKNSFNDNIDCVEIRNLKLKVKQKINC